MPTWDPHDYERNSAIQEGWARDCLERLRLRGDERVLDVGCGDGRISAQFPDGNAVPAIGSRWSGFALVEAAGLYSPT